MHSVAPGRSKSVLRFAPKEVLSPKDVSALSKASNSAASKFIKDRIDGKPAAVTVPAEATPDTNPYSSAAPTGPAAPSGGAKAAYAYSAPTFAAATPSGGLPASDIADASNPYNTPITRPTAPSGGLSASDLDDASSPYNAPLTKPAGAYSAPFNPESTETPESESTETGGGISGPSSGPREYTKLKDMKGKLNAEFTGGSNTLKSVVEDVLPPIVAEGKVASVGEAMKLGFGWDQADVDRWLGKVSNIGGDAGAEKPLVANVKDPKDREAFVLNDYPFKQGESKELFDTTTHFSKFAGKGFAIFVMDSTGKIYAGQHKVGLFHHSSFLSGSSVAAAGEMKVEKGQIKVITNKSGHYHPNEDHVKNSFDELGARGVNVAGLELRFMGPGDAYNGKEPYKGGPTQFVKDMPDLKKKRLKAEKKLAKEKAAKKAEKAEAAAKAKPEPLTPAASSGGDAGGSDSRDSDRFYAAKPADGGTGPYAKVGGLSKSDVDAAANAYAPVAGLPKADIDTAANAYAKVGGLPKADVDAAANAYAPVTGLPKSDIIDSAYSTHTGNDSETAETEGEESGTSTAKKANPYDTHTGPKKKAYAYGGV